MPELPEVETIKKGLTKAIVGKKIVGVEVLEKKSFKGEPKEIIGGTVEAVRRRAKLLIIQIPNYQLQITNYLLVHLKLTGQLVFRRELKAQSSKLKANKSPYDIDQLPNKFTRVIISFDDGSRLFFNDLRKFGWMKVIKTKNQKPKTKNINEKLKIEKTKKLDAIIGQNLGPEPFSSQFTLEYLKEILAKWGRPVKLLLIEQKKIAGIGNIYANEALFCARVAPHHRGRDLVKEHPEKVAKLYECVKKVLNEGLKYGGSSAADEAYRKVNGTKGQMQEHFKVYQKDGEDCPHKCGAKIRRMTLAGRGTFFCPRCQR